MPGAVDSGREVAWTHDVSHDYDSTSRAGVRCTVGSMPSEAVVDAKWYRQTKYIVVALALAAGSCPGP